MSEKSGTCSLSSGSSQIGKRLASCNQFGQAIRGGILVYYVGWDEAERKETTIIMWCFVFTRIVLIFLFTQAIPVVKNLRAFDFLYWGWTS